MAWMCVLDLDLLLLRVVIGIDIQIDIDTFFTEQLHKKRIYIKKRYNSWEYVYSKKNVRIYKDFTKL